MNETKKIKEKVIEDYLKTHIKKMGGMVIKLAPFYVSGLPDRLVLLPPGRAIFVELKRPSGGVLSKIQSYVHRKLADIGFRVRLLNSKESIEQEFTES